MGISKISGNSAGSPGSESGILRYLQGRQPGAAMTISGMYKIVAGLSFMVLLSIGTIQTIYWARISEISSYGLPIILVISLTSGVCIIVGILRIKKCPNNYSNAVVMDWHEGTENKKDI